MLYMKMATDKWLQPPSYYTRGKADRSLLNRTKLSYSFGLPPKADSSPARQQVASRCLPQSVIQRSQSCNQEAANYDEAVPDLMDEPAQPGATVYLEPSFSL